MSEDKLILPDTPVEMVKLVLTALIEKHLADGFKTSKFSDILPWVILWKELTGDDSSTLKDLFGE